MTQQRKIVFFLGAGASLGAGAYAVVQRGGHVPIPTQENFWEIFLKFCGSQKNRRDIESFLFRYFLGYARVPAKRSETQRRKLLATIDVEEVFTFLSERAQAPSTSASLKSYSLKIWNALIIELGHVFRRFEANSDTESIYRRFRRQYVRARDTIVSFNYDTVFEDSLTGNFNWHYEGISSAVGSVGILKPHGSINWDSTNPIIVQDTPTSPLIVAPTHLKFVQTRSDTIGYLDQSTGIRNVWSIMESEMKTAKALVFIGYSFPMADLYFSSILRSVLADRSSPGIAIVNPDAIAIRRRLQQRFALEKVSVYFDLVTFAQGSRKQLLDGLDRS
jgi:SIR2-like protein